MNKILKLAIVLFLVCAVAAGALGFVNNLTAPIIFAQAQAKTAAAFASVMQADGYEEIEFDKESFPTVDTIHRATNGASAATDASDTSESSIHASGEAAMTVAKRVSGR